MTLIKVPEFVFGNPELALSIKWYWKIMRFPAV